MAGAGERIRGAAGLALIVASPFAAHAATQGDRPVWLVAGVAAAQLAALACLAGARARRFRLAMIMVASALVVGAIFGAGLPARAVGLAAAGFSHAAAYGALLAWFAASLRPGREPAITVFARRMRRSMPERVVRYTRAVTWAWCVFFAAELAASAMLLLWAPAAVWSGFINMASMPLIAAMMLGEFTIRAILFRHESRGGLAATLAGLRGWRSAGG